MFLNKFKNIGNDNKRGIFYISEDDPEDMVSPHMRKCTLYNNELMDFGLCKINFQPIG